MSGSTAHVKCWVFVFRKKRTYCVFDSKLARIVQEQGRGGQLHISFGSASSPNCRGVTVAEMQHIDWKVIDYSDFYSELEDNMTLPDSGSLTDRIREQIQSQMNGVNQ
ncbi:TraN [Klebsiella pneumoniae subsp. ozaenae]|uniref:TraN n=1 Tax=Klebsiella pneumoniae subsp. ozaenae TaxID=574 RepID=A0A378UCC9_KLEPO|nr:TraN [Klebsiella pneumoniae subsp. ozaenae]